MIFWIAVAGLTLITLAAVLWPLLAGGPRGGRKADYDIEVYRDQLAEVDRNLERGVIGAEEAEAAKAEVGRRILAADARRRGEQAPGGAPPEGRPLATRIAVGVVAVAIPAAAFGLYLQLGSPGMEARPFAERQTQPSGSGTQMAGGGEGEAGSLQDAEARLAQRLENNPDDVQGWVLLGRTRMMLSKFGSAATAYQRAVTLAPERTELHAAYGEALTMAAGGSVTKAAREAFRTALDKAPGDPRARYYMALAAYQDGEPRTALEEWQKLASAAPSDAPWLSVVETRIRETRQSLGLPVEEQPRTQTAERSTGNGGGPTQEDMAAAQSMSPDERRQMIKGMVQRLAERLEENPDNPEGWQRLARSYEVLGRISDARDAYEKAAELAPDNVEVLTRYARVVRSAAGNSRTSTSKELMRRVLEVDPRNPEALWFSAMAELDAGRKGEARELFDKALDQLPKGSPQTAELRDRAESLLNAQ